MTEETTDAAVASESRSFGILHYIIPVIVLIVGVASLMGLSSLRKAPESTTPERLPPLVETVAVESHQEGIKFSIDGEVIPYRELSLSAEISGRILRKSPDCRAGRFVAKGALLLEIDPRDYDFEVRRLQSLVRQAEVSIAELDVERENAVALQTLAGEELILLRNELKRVKSLYDRRAASDSEWDTARRNELTARNTLQTLRNKIRLLEASRGRLLSDIDRLGAELEKAQLNRTRAEIRAPIDGIVMDDLVEQDAYVTAGTMLVQLQDTSKVEVRFNLRTDQLRWLWLLGNGSAASSPSGSLELPNAPVTVAYDLDGQFFYWQGRLSRYDGAAMNAATRTMPCIAVVDDPQGGRAAGQSSAKTNVPPPALIRGMFVTVQLQVRTAQSLLSLPTSAVRPGNRLWVVRDDKLSIEAANVAQALEDEVLLLAGATSLKPGDRVITSPLPVAVAGMEIRTHPSPGVAPVNRLKVAQEETGR